MVPLLAALFLDSRSVLVQFNVELLFVSFCLFLVFLLFLFSLESPVPLLSAGGEVTMVTHIQARDWPRPLS